MNNNIKALFEEKGIQSSYHRFKILEFLMKNRIHPTADEIYLKLSKQIPTLSKTTVYNTLKILSERKIISQIMVEGNEIKYDYSEKPHLHFKCKICGKIYDIYHKCELLTKKEIQGHIIEEYHLYLKGICKNCRKK